jgi:hypothetical protein
MASRACTVLVLRAACQAFKLGNIRSYTLSSVIFAPSPASGNKSTGALEGLMLKILHVRALGELFWAGRKRRVLRVWSRGGAWDEEDDISPCALKTFKWY